MFVFTPWTYWHTPSLNHFPVVDVRLNLLFVYKFRPSKSNGPTFRRT
jgi:hypothetical protein